MRFIPHPARAAAALLALLLAAPLTACSSVADKAESMANRSFTSYAEGKPYSEIASLGSSPLERLSVNSDRATFGPMIGETRLTNGMTIYRHMAPATRKETSTSFGGLVGTSTEDNNNRLSYFLVGPDGYVKDWATGAVQGSTSDCISYIGGIIKKCTDSGQMLAALALYDSRVLTKSGQPISVWGTPAPAAPMAPPPRARRGAR